MPQTSGLASRELGEGAPVLVIHGWTMNGLVEADDFEPIFEKHDGYRRIYPDLPGMGESPIGDARDLDSMLEILCGFVEERILPSKFLLIGTSCPAYLARTLAYRYGESIDGLLLRVPVVEPQSARRDVDPFKPVISNEASMSSASELYREDLGDVPVQTPEYITTRKDKFEATVIPAMKASDSEALDPIRDDPDRYVLSATMHSPEEPFSKPSLILTGRQDSDVGYRDAWPLVKCYPRATFAAFDRADHGLPIDEMDTQLFQALVVNWLRRVEEVGLSCEE